VSGPIYLNAPFTFLIDFLYIFKLFIFRKSSKFIKERLYAGGEVKFQMKLDFKGVDPSIILGNAIMYCGSSGYCPAYNFIQSSNPGGLGNKEVSISVIRP
jgi:hypothetical protein